MSTGSTMKRQRRRSLTPARSSARTAGAAPITYLPGVRPPAGSAPLCRDHAEPMVYLACECHPHTRGWACSRSLLDPHMKRLR